jgi:integrase
MAHERARQALDDIRAGGDPAAARRQRQQRITWTFEKVAGAYIDSHRAGWKNQKHAAQWESTLKAYAYPQFGSKHVADVTKADVLAAVEGIWTTKHETARRVRSRIELVLSYAMQREYRPEGQNPARLKGNLDVALPTSKRLAGRRGHHAALPIDGMHDFMARLREVDGMGARALEFAILTAARSGEVRGATWSEIDLESAEWRIPAERMKSGRPHRVPLSGAAVALLQALPRFDSTPLVFAGRGDKPISDMTLTAALRRMKVDVTAHGFRSSFRDWSSERTATPREVAEMALAHAIGDDTEAAYRRGDLFEKRRVLMDMWANFIDTAPATGNVRALPARGSA